MGVIRQRKEREEKGMSKREQAMQTSAKLLEIGTDVPFFDNDIYALAHEIERYGEFSDKEREKLLDIALRVQELAEKLFGVYREGKAC